MKKGICLWALFLLCGLMSSAFSMQEKMGLGIFTGKTTGISGKYWLNDSMAIDAATRWTFGERENLWYIHSDFLIHRFDQFRLSSGKLPIYYGGGLQATVGDDDRLGLRAPIGLEYLLGEAPVDIFVEVAPTFDFIPEAQFDFNGAIGIRYFFGRRGSSLFVQPSGE